MTGDRSGESAEDLFLELQRSRDPAVRDRLVALHLDLARYLARRFTSSGEPYDDLVQVASIGLVQAVDRFDPSRGVAFSTYASQTILGELKRHLRDKGWSIRAPRRLQELYIQLNQLSSRLSQELGHSPTVRELAREAGVTEEDVLEALEAGRAYRSASLDAAATEDGQGLIETLGAEGEGFREAEARAVLMPLIPTLSPREQTILRLRFFEDQTQSQIADQLEISQMHVSRLLARSLTRLREAAREQPPAPQR